jgi:hypothetical protein
MSEYYKKIFEKTPKETELEAELMTLDKEFEASEEYISYRKRRSVLLNELYKERQDKKINIGPRPKRERKLNSHKREDINYSASESTLEEYDKLSESDKKYFNAKISLKNGLDKYENPVTTNDNIKELQEILVQVCINFINSNKLTDIDEVHFNADGLQCSASFGEWTPSTDSYIKVIGEQDGIRKIIGENI